LSCCWKSNPPNKSRLHVEFKQQDQKISGSKQQKTRDICAFSIVGTVAAAFGSVMRHSALGAGAAKFIFITNELGEFSSFRRLIEISQQ
jgi:hypothetical protein